MFLSPESKKLKQSGVVNESPGLLEVGAAGLQQEEERVAADDDKGSRSSALSISQCEQMLIQLSKNVDYFELFSQRNHRENNKQRS